MPVRLDQIGVGNMGWEKSELLVPDGVVLGWTQPTATIMNRKQSHTWHASWLKMVSMRSWIFSILVLLSTRIMSDCRISRTDML